MASVNESKMTDERVDAKDIAEEVLAELTDSERLRGIGYYTPDECDTVYLRNDVERASDDPKRPLEDAVLESVSLQTLEDIFSDELTGTIRFFETMVVFYSCSGEHQGVVVTFDRKCDLDYAEVLRTLERITGKRNARR